MQVRVNNLFFGVVVGVLSGCSEPHTQGLNIYYAICQCTQCSLHFIVILVHTLIGYWSMIIEKCQKYCDIDINQSMACDNVVPLYRIGYMVLAKLSSLPVGHSFTIHLSHIMYTGHNWLSTSYCHIMIYFYITPPKQEKNIDLAM